MNNKNKLLHNWCPVAELVKLLVLSYAKYIGKKRAISSGNLEEIDIIWQPQIKDSLKSYLDLFHYYFNY